MNPTHLAQAKCYAYMYAQQHSLERMRVRLVYCHVETEQVRNFDDDFSFSELEVFPGRPQAVWNLAYLERAVGTGAQ
ncbi:MAG: hypothetical protein ACLR23_18780 [Clostridia bacterium]